jgi:hypothetical protein
MHTKFWSDKQNGTIHLRDLGVPERIILEWMINTVVGCGLDSPDSG